MNSIVNSLTAIGVLFILARGAIVLAWGLIPTTQEPRA